VQWDSSCLRRSYLEYHPFIQKFDEELYFIQVGDGSVDPMDKATWNGKHLTKLQLGIWHYMLLDQPTQQHTSSLKN
jgi:hypothetical protein